MKCSLGISNFLEEISSLCHSVVFLYFFALITEEGFLISPCYSLELCIQMGIFFLFYFAFSFSSFLLSWFQIGKGVRQGCILSPCLFNLYAEYIVRNTGLEEAQAGIKIAWKNINNLRYADDTTLMAESEEELKSLSMKVKQESEKVGLKLIQKTKIMASGPITSWEIDGETVETVSDFIFGGAPKSLQMVIAVMKLKDAYSLDGKL